MMKVIEGHFNPLRRHDKTIYSHCLTEKIWIYMKEKCTRKGGENNRTGAGVVFFLQFHLNMQERKRTEKDVNIRKRRANPIPDKLHNNKGVTL